MTSLMAMIVNMQMGNECIVNKAVRFESALLTRHSSVSGFITFDLWGGYCDFYYLLVFNLTSKRHSPTTYSTVL